MSLFTELIRRNVFRIATAYAVASWLLLQMADLFLDNIGAPPWVMQSLFVLVGVGFVFALIFSWLYELTPEGVMREADVPRDRSIAFHTARKLDYLTIALLLAAVTFVIVDRYVLEAPVPAPAQTPETAAAAAPTAPLVEPNSIAVLPFSDFSAEGDQQYFSDGIAEELLNLLARVEGLKVASRTSSFTYKGENLDIPEIAAQLKVANILEGSVRKVGNRVRITAQLIDTRDDRHLWSETYDRELVDIFAIQDEIASAIVDALQTQLGVRASAQDIVVEAATDNLDAYELYLKGRTLFTARQRLGEAIALFERAIDLDPNFARAWEGLAAAQAVANDWQLGDGIDHAPLAIPAAEKAIALNPELSMPYAVLGNVGEVPGVRSAIPDVAESMQLFDLALEKDSSNTTAWLWRGVMYDNMGFFEKALADFDECLARDPAYLNCAQHRAAALLFMGRTQDALDAFVPTLYENFHSMDEAFVSVLVEQGNSVAAVALATARIAIPDSPVGLWIEALENPDQDQSARLAKLDRWVAQSGQDIGALWPDFLLALHAYERAAHNPYLRFTLFSPASRAFRQTPWFKQFARTMGYEAYWREHGFPPSCQVTGDGDYRCN